jgi:hypothetical protein
MHPLLLSEYFSFVIECSYSDQIVSKSITFLCQFSVDRLTDLVTSQMTTLSFPVPLSGKVTKHYVDSLPIVKRRGG